jgi:hypothetical protein
MFRVGKADTAEIAVAEHHGFGAQPAQILVAEIEADKLPIGPC